MARRSTIEDSIQCPKCAHTQIIKAGIFDDRQRYRCKNCGTYFFTETRRIERTSVHRRVAALMYLAGATMKDLRTLFKASPDSIGQLIKRAEILLEEAPDIEKLKRTPAREVFTVSSLAKIPHADKKRWLVIEIDEEIFDKNSVVISQKY